MDAPMFPHLPSLIRIPQTTLKECSRDKNMIKKKQLPKCIMLGYVIRAAAAQGHVSNQSLRKCSVFALGML